jgi:agmatine/peptidylarginine deiminase
MNCNRLVSQDKPIKEVNKYTHHMSPEEKALFHLVGKDFLGTDPPPGPVMNIAEFDKMEGVLVGYPGNFGITYSLIAAMSEETVVTTVVESNSQLNYVTNQYQSNGVNMSNANFIVAPLDSYWTRDYGPWYVRYGDDQIGIIDFIYNRPNRPNDDALPTAVAQFLGIEWFGMDLIHTGGNYMTDGYGISSSSELVYEENPTLTVSQIEQLMMDYLGIETYHVVPDPNNTYIDHIDCWGKFLGVNKVLIREVPTSHPQYDEIEATADYYAAQLSSWGTPYEVYRIWTPGNEPYTNSLILNDRVFVPVTGGAWDDEALAAYEEAMPGYEILGITGSWESTDALHCRTNGIADRNMLHIEHFPLLGEQPVQNEYTIDAQLTAYSGENINSSEVKLIYSINGGVFQEVIMTYEGGKLYSAIISVEEPGSEIAYYLTATDEAGNSANHPFIGEPDPHTFYAGEQLFPAIALDVTEINAYVNQGNTDVEMFSISNNGQLNLNFSLDWSSAILEDHDFEVGDSPSPGSWNSNTYTELGWTEMEIDNIVGEIAGWSISFDWETDNWPEESTFKVKSPSGTETVVGGGFTNGSYTIALSDFDGEQMQGTWLLWITDSYGDGGHKATDINITITKTYTIFPWLSLNTSSGTIAPGGSQSIEVTCNGGVLPVGDYEGKIWVSSNDPINNQIEIPVYFTVDVASGIEAAGFQDEFISNYPNPFFDETSFYLKLNGYTKIYLEIFDLTGATIITLADDYLGAGNHQLRWNGKNSDGTDVNRGVYFYRFVAGDLIKTGKLILTK